MNDVTVSGIIKGDFEKISNDGLRFSLVVRGRDGADNDEFVALAYGNSAAFLEAHAESGQRIVMQGRISSEKLGTENYHHALTINRVLAICDSSMGIDYTHAVISGTARSDGLKNLNNSKQTAVLGLNITNTREYKRDGETNVYTTFLSATVWGANAERLAAQQSFPISDVPVVLDGILKPRSYEKDGASIGKIDVWVNDIQLGGATASPEDSPAERSTSRKQTSPASSSGRAKKLTDAPF